MADTSIKLSGTYDSIEAYRILEEMRDMSEDCEDIKEEAEAASSAATAAVATANAAVTNATTAANNASTYAGNANASASDAAGYAANASTSATNAATSEGNASDSADAAALSASAAADSADEAEAAAELVKKDLPLPIGYEYFSFNPNIPQGSLPLFGGEYARDTYSDLWAWVQTQTGYLKTEAEWQTLSTANNGNVPYYSDGDGSTTFRVPSLKCWVRGANGTVSEVGSYLAAGLPNITGSISQNGDRNVLGSATGAFYGSGNMRYWATASSISASNEKLKFDFDASRSSSVYGNANTVVPESIVGMWLVKAYGVIVDTGSIDEQQYIDDRYNAMKTYVDGKFDSVVAKGTNYIRYDSGLQICWGEEVLSASTSTTFAVPFISTPALVTATNTALAGTGATSLGKTNFTANLENYPHSFRYVAVGWWK